MFGYAKTGAVDSEVFSASNAFWQSVSIQMRYFSAEADLEVMQ